MKKTKLTKKPSEKPVGAFVLSLIGGILITVSGIVLITISKLLSDRIGQIVITEGSYITLEGLGLPIAGLKLILGILIIAGAATVFKSQKLRLSWGITIVVFSIISLIVSVFPPEPVGIIGAIMGILGGALALAYRE